MDQVTGKMHNVSFAKARSADARREAEPLQYYVSPNEPERTPHCCPLLRKDLNCAQYGQKHNFGLISRLCSRRR